MKIQNNMLEGFKRQAMECIQQVKEKDSGTLQYDWFLSSDNTECEVHETYESSEALLDHLSNISDLLGALFEKYATDPSVAIYGQPSTELLENIKTKGLDVKIYSFLEGL